MNFVATFDTVDQLLTLGFPESRVYLFLGGSQNHREHRDLGDIAEASEPP
jgi:hypothetical protein